MNSHLFSYLLLKKIFTLKKSSKFANLLIEKPGIDLLQFFYKQPVYKQLPLAWKLLSNFQASTPFH